ncbi:spore maturation protein [Paraflavitalea sp. CAU 1676]|uniref:nucleoside recognition domain-containing protein n=1 Tax=Paraflavitalea sp. CAU 1676 TaxID=3032598 RepID=UPI0023DC29D4|nr:spore maturation protein [Paraflavitalea sp. CAU 1676]MDF2192802.1 nucleoside recognition domain-containing protein [Paraflavitalea sp. CAU 1676]
MVLNYLWISFFLIAFVVALVKLIFLGDTQVFKTMMDGVFDSAKGGVDISLGLIGVMSLFLGFMQIGERAGAINVLSRIVGPFFNKLFPGVPPNHPAMGHMMMNFSANLLQLDNAATPFGLKAMESLQELNPQKDTASDAQVMFMVLHASGLSIIPVSVIAQRVIVGSKNATDIFIPCVICTFVATMVAMIITAFKQRFTSRQWVAIGLFSIIGSSCLAGLAVLLRSLTPENATIFSNVLSTGLIMLLFVTFILGGMYKKIAVYDAFIDGAKQGFEVAVKIIPYLVGMLVAISVLRSSGVFDYIIQGAQWLFAQLGFNTDFVPSLPTALMRPFSGSGSRALMIDAMKTYGPDTFIGRLSCMFQGSADTTFYVVALYFGSVGIKRTRYAIPASLLADLAGIITAIIVAYNWPWG